MNWLFDATKKDNKAGAQKPTKRPVRKQVTVYLPPDLVKQLKVQAATDDKEMSEIATAALLSYLGKTG